MLDAHRVRGTGRHTHRDGTVVDAPARRVRHIELRTETPVRVDVRAQEGHLRRQGLEHTADRVSQRGVLLGILAGKDVVAFFVENRNVHVQTVARLARIRLGHKRGVHLVVVGDVLHQTLEQHRVVAGLYRVVDVMQVHFELRRGAFLDDGVGRNALLFRAFKDVLQAVDVFIQVVDQIHLGRHRTLARDRRTWRLRTTVHVVLVDQVELKLERRADGQAHVVELAHHIGQHFTRVSEERLAFQFVHGHQQLRGWTLLPRLDAQSARDGIADSIRVADVQTQAGAFHRRTIDVQSKQRRRQVNAFFVNLMKTGAFDALAAHHTVHIRNQKVDVQNLRIFLKECVCFVELNGTQRDRHDAPISC